MGHDDHYDAVRLGREVDMLEVAGFLGFQQNLRGLSVSFDAYHLVPGSNTIKRLKVRIVRGWVNGQDQAEYKIVARREILRWWIPDSEGPMGLRTPLGDGLANWLKENSYFPNRTAAAERRAELEAIMVAYAGGRP